MRRIEEVKSGENAGSFRGIFAWLSPAGEAMLEEDRKMTFRDGGELRIVDVDLTLKALADTTFADSKDGAFSVRLAEPLTEKNVSFRQACVRDRRAYAPGNRSHQNAAHRGAANLQPTRDLSLADASTA
jgi:hypothetical protein